MSAMERLDDHIEGHAPEGLPADPPDTDEPEDTGRWRIRDHGAADWAMRKAARVAAEMDDISAAASARRAQIDEWEIAERERLQRQLNWWAMQLSAWHRTKVEEDPKGNLSIVLPSGRLTSRKKPDDWTMSDEFVSWARANRSELVRCTVTLKGSGDVVEPTAVRHVLAELVGEDRVDELLSVVEAPDKNAVKKALTGEDGPVVNADGQVIDVDTGAAVPGVTWAKGEREFSIEPGGGDA